MVDWSVISIICLLNITLKQNVDPQPLCHNRCAGWSRRHDFLDLAVVFGQAFFQKACDHADRVFDQTGVFGQAFSQKGCAQAVFEKAYNKSENTIGLTHLKHKAIAINPQLFKINILNTTFTVLDFAV